MHRVVRVTPKRVMVEREPGSGTEKPIPLSREELELHGSAWFDAGGLGFEAWGPADTRVRVPGESRHLAL